MFGRFWLASFETWAVVQLLRSPTFHRAVGAVHRRINRIRNGLPVEEMGGTKIDVPKESKFLHHFIDEIKKQGGFNSIKKK